MWNLLHIGASFAVGVVILSGMTAGWVQNPAIQITVLPSYGGSGFMSGAVTGVGDCSAYSVAAYIQVEGLGWWTKPTLPMPTVPVDSNCTFAVNVVTGGLDSYATIFCAALVSLGYTPPSASGSARVPSDLVATAIDFKERYGRIISFAGRTWAVKEAPLPVGPGSNRFSAALSDVWVDSAGLHLTIHQQNGSWWSSEVILLDHLGFGIYNFKTRSRTDILDPNATFGMFTWDSYGDDESSGASHNREIDFEDSRWGIASDPNTQAVVQPWYVSGNLHRYSLPELSGDPALTRIISWFMPSIRFLTLLGDQSPTTYPPSSVVDDWTYSHDPGPGHYVPPPGRESVRLNLWLNRSAPANAQDVEVLITDFVFVKPSVRRGQLTSQ
jgi:hypothetical protein